MRLQQGDVLRKLWIFQTSENQVVAKMGNYLGRKSFNIIGGRCVLKIILLSLKT